MVFVNIFVFTIYMDVIVCPFQQMHKLYFTVMLCISYKND